MIQFEWDEEKERKNIKKHGIDFRTAALVFYDSNRLNGLMRFILRRNFAILRLVR